MKRECKQCGKEFELSHSEIKFYKERNLALPRRCKECRDANKQKKGGPDKPYEAQAKGEQGGQPGKPDKEQRGRMQEGQPGNPGKAQSGKGHGTPPGEEKKTKAGNVQEVQPAKIRGPQSEEADKRQTDRIQGMQTGSRPANPRVKFGALAAAAVLVVAFALKALFGWSEPVDPANSAIRNQGEDIPAPGRSAEGVKEDIDGSAGITFRNEELLEEHFQKHGIGMGFSTAEEYQAAAAAVVGNADSLHKSEAEDGDDVYYLESTNEFVIVSTDGYIRTYFNPDAGIDYYNRQ